MIRPAIGCALALLGAAFAAPAEEVALKFKTIPAQQVVDFPGGLGSIYLPVHAGKPATVKKEPKTTSRRTLYSNFRSTAGGVSLLMRLHESQDGKGYDRLIVDINRNGDLTDDPIVGLVNMPSEPAGKISPNRQLVFGPIVFPADKTIAGGRLIYFAHGYVNSLASSQPPSSGYMRLRAGWYLEGEVELEGAHHKIGLYDGDANFQIGDIGEPRTYTSAGQQSWSFGAADSFLMDVDGSGSFDKNGMQAENSPFGRVLYLGSKPYRVSVAKDCASMNIEPWPQVELATVSLEPQAKAVSYVSLAWEQPGGKWQLIRPNAADGKISVPAGNYRLYGCALAGGAGQERVMTTGTQREPKTPVAFAPGQPNKLTCGAPLNVNVTTSIRAATRLDELLGRSSAPTRIEPGARVVAINAKLTGADGEIYSTFGQGQNFTADPPKPTYVISDTSGKKIASGNLEYG